MRKTEEPAQVQSHLTSPMGHGSREKYCRHPNYMHLHINEAKTMAREASCDACPFIKSIFRVQLLPVLISSPPGDYHFNFCYKCNWKPAHLQLTRFAITYRSPSRQCTTQIYSTCATTSSCCGRILSYFQRYLLSPECALVDVDDRRLACFVHSTHSFHEDTRSCILILCWNYPECDDGFLDGRPGSWPCPWPPFDWCTISRTPLSSFLVLTAWTMCHF